MAPAVGKIEDERAVFDAGKVAKGMMPFSPVSRCLAVRNCAHRLFICLIFIFALIRAIFNYSPVSRRLIVPPFEHAVVSFTRSKKKIKELPGTRNSFSVIKPK